MRIKKTAFLVAFIIAIKALHAQDTTFMLSPENYKVDTGMHTNSQWTLQFCIDYAIKNNIGIINLRLNSESSEQDIMAAKAAKLPNLNGDASQVYTHSKNANPVVGGFQTESSFTGNYSVNSNITIYNGNYLNTDIKLKQLLLQTSNINVVQNEMNITLQITQAFLNIMLAKENLVYLKDLVNTTAAQVKQEQQLYDAGAVAKVNLVSLQAQLANDQYSLVQGQNTLRQNNLSLKQLLQLPIDTAFEVQSPDSISAERIYPSLDVAVDAALQTRPEVKGGVLSVQESELVLQEARAALYPTLVGTGALSSGYSDQSGPIFRQLDNNFFQQVGLTLSVPIFNRRINKTAIEKDKLGLVENEYNLQNAKMVLSQEVEQAYINILNSESQYDASISALASAKESYRITSAEFKLGATDAVTLLVQKNLYIQSLESYIQAKYNTVLYIKIYEYYMGTPVKL